MYCFCNEFSQKDIAARSLKPVCSYCMEKEREVLNQTRNDLFSKDKFGLPVETNLKQYDFLDLEVESASWDKDY